MRLFVDPGSPPAELGEEFARLYRSYAVHGGIALDDRDPYPLDHPFYSDEFRQLVAGPRPSLRSTGDGVRLISDGYGRLGGHKQLERSWRFDGDRLTIDDLVLGTGRPQIARRLVTPWQVTASENGLVLEQDGQRLHLTGDVPATLHPAKGWRADGGEEALTLILFSQQANLPWRGSLTLQPIAS
jgi:hypothetical protein